MESLPKLKLVGLVVGKIQLSAAPIMFSLYITKKGKHYRTSSLCKAGLDCATVVRAVVDGLPSKRQFVYKNAAPKPWFYVKLMWGYGPVYLSDWDLPQAVYRLPWEKVTLV